MADTKNIRYRNVCFTLPNYTQAELEFLNAVPVDLEDGLKYLVFQQEICPTTGTAHIQGYAEFSKKLVMSTVKLLLTGDKKSRIHIESRMGTQKEASVYCKKEESRVPDTIFVERGTISCPGKRNDLETIVSDIETRGLSYAIDEHKEKYLLLNKGMKAYAQHCLNKKPKEPPHVFWFYGITGSGKSRDASIMFPNAWLAKRDLQWFDDYEGQENVIIDDFRADFCKFHELLRILDRYPYSAPVKGGFVNWVPKNICITSCFPPEKVYASRSQEDIQQLLRRIHTIRFYPRINSYCTMKNVSVDQAFEQSSEISPEELARILSQQEATKHSITTADLESKQ